MSIMCCAYGINAFQPTLFIRLYSADKLRIWGDEKTKFRFGSAGAVKKLIEQPGYGVRHLFNNHPAFLTAYPGQWGSVNIAAADITFPVTLEIEYAPDSLNAGIRANGGSVSGRLPDSLESWTAMFVNNVASCPDPNFISSGFSSYGIENWDSVKGGIKHFNLIDYRAYLDNASFQNAADVFDLRGNEVLQTYYANGLGASPADMGLSPTATLRYLVDRSNEDLTHNNPAGYLQGLNLSNLELGAIFGRPDMSGSAQQETTAAIFAAMVAAGTGPAAPGARIDAGFFDPTTAEAVALTEAGYSLTNGNN